MNSISLRVLAFSALFLCAQSVSHAGVFGWLGDLFGAGTKVAKEHKKSSSRQGQKQEVNVNIKPNYTGAMLITVAAGVSVAVILNKYGIKQMPQAPVEIEIKEKLDDVGFAQIRLCDNPDTGKPFAIVDGFDTCPWKNVKIYMGPKLTT